MGDVHDASYYAKCMVGGIFACGVTHAAVCPLDIVKCRMQVSYTPSRLFCPIQSSLIITVCHFLRDRLTPACTPVSPTASGPSRPLKASRVSPS